VRSKLSGSFCALKAPEDWRSPRRFADTSGRAAKRASVLECGGLPPLFLLNLLKAKYLSFFDKKDLTNRIDWFIVAP
jgi:hypothetical protein